MWTLLVSSVWAQAVDFECFPAGPDGQVRGEPPVTVSCDLVVDALYEFSEAEWIMGDGTALTGSSIEHTYDEPGQYDVHVYLDDFGYAVDTGLAEVPSSEVKRGLVTVCDAPVAEFSYVFKGGLDYQMVNRSDFIPDCLDTLEWTVYRGEGRTGDIVDEAPGWEPRFVLPEEGTYTFVLDLGGLAGNSAAKLSVDAQGGLSDDYDHHKPSLCATAPAMAHGLWLLPLMGLVRRRS